MTLMDKLEIGLKEDAPFRKDNLPESQVRGPEVESGPGRSPGVPAARADRNTVTDSDESMADSDERKPEESTKNTSERKG